MKLALIKPKSVNVDPWAQEFANCGVDVLENSVQPDCDFILCASISQLNKLEYFHNMYPDIPMINYNWDLYEWIWTSPGGYDWKKYGAFLNKSAEIWCPSDEVVLRTQEYYNCGEKCKVIKTFVRLFDYPEEKIKDKRYIFQPMRYYHEDRNFGWLKKACKELDIRLVESLHKASEEEFKKIIANCSFLVCEYYEASTGGLTLLEGYNLGKPILISDSKYMGGRDYFGDDAIYFKHDSYDNFKHMLLELWNNTEKYTRTLEESKKLTKEYTVEIMVKVMHQRLLELSI
tara:strand:- start:1850 stop:2713 length:864 start_codon:yes stop_codon:yes gene_type:complete